MKPFEEPILVSRPYLPPLERVQGILAEAWDNCWLTNNGPLHQRFEARLRDVLQTEHLALFANGTIAMELALRALDLPRGGRVITTPFSFVATPLSIINAGLEPVFVDIRKEDATLDPDAVQAAIDDRTVAIAPVHVYGFPCQMDALQAIADRHKLKLVYDAAHAFGVQVNGRCVGEFGDASMFSLHATKLFHAVECGVIVSRDAGLLSRLNHMKNFGFAGPAGIVPGGTNAKLSELHAAVGLACCDDFELIMLRRKEQAKHYREGLAGVPGIHVFPLPPSTVAYNHSYLPILVDEDVYGGTSEWLQSQLEQYNVFSRRYFRPLLSDAEAFSDVPVAGRLNHSCSIAEEVLCLPIYHELKSDQIDRICHLIRSLSRQTA